MNLFNYSLISPGIDESDRYGFKKRNNHFYFSINYRAQMKINDNNFL